MSGDYLKYSTHIGTDTQLSSIYTYGGTMSGTGRDDSIAVTLHEEGDLGDIVNGKIVNSTDTLLTVNLCCGIVDDIHTILYPSPVNTDRWLKYSTSASYWKDKVTEGYYNYDGMQRMVIIISDTNQKQIIDKETGISLFYQNGLPDYKEVLLTEKLVSTNIIQAPNTNQNTQNQPLVLPQSSQQNRSQIQIPSWVKNNAKWWSEGSVGDGDFVKEIQYLLQQRIILIPQIQAGSSSSQSVPQWIKNSAAWWANGQISDNEFVKSIQYLAQAGIIQVNTPLQCDQTLWNHVYHPQRLKIIDSCKTVTGVIQNIKKEADGDYHIQLKLDSQFSNLINSANVQYQHGYLVLEPVCQGTVTQSDAKSACVNYQSTLTIPPKGSHVTVTGTYVLDLQHDSWAEIHPISHIAITS